MKTTFRNFARIFTLCFLVTFISCNKTDTADPEPDTTVYAKAEYWLSLPSENVKNVDVFYLYPTAWYKIDSSESNICGYDNKIMIAGSKSAFKRQATAFETLGNIYAPYYRQADAIYTLSLPENERWEVINGTPAKDVTAAFDYYIKNYNKGRPFILLGHSQGANVVLILLQDYMTKHPDVYARMICAYVIGYPVTAQYLAANPHLKFAERADDLGVIISYNTQSPNVAPGGNIVVGNNIGIVINPINWRRDEVLATTNESLGSYMPIDSLGNFGMVNNFADARINLAKGVLECVSVSDSAMFKIASALGLGVYHSFDIPFYYYNLRENAQTRINKFFNN